MQEKAVRERCRHNESNAAGCEHWPHPAAHGGRRGRGDPQGGRGGGGGEIRARSQAWMPSRVRFPRPLLTVRFPQPAGLGTIGLFTSERRRSFFRHGAHHSVAENNNDNRILVCSLDVDLRGILRPMWVKSCQKRPKPSQMWSISGRALDRTKPRSERLREKVGRVWTVSGQIWPTCDRFFGSNLADSGIWPNLVQTCPMSGQFCSILSVGKATRPKSAKSGRFRAKLTRFSPNSFDPDSANSGRLRPELPHFGQNCHGPRSGTLCEPLKGSANCRQVCIAASPFSCLPDGAQADPELSTICSECGWRPATHPVSAESGDMTMWPQTAPTHAQRNLGMPSENPELRDTAATTPRPGRGLRRNGRHPSMARPMGRQALGRDGPGRPRRNRRRVRPARTSGETCAWRRGTYGDEASAKSCTRRWKVLLLSGSEVARTVVRQGVPARRSESRAEHETHNRSTNVRTK